MASNTFKQWWAQYSTLDFNDAWEVWQAADQFAVGEAIRRDTYIAALERKLAVLDGMLAKRPCQTGRCVEHNTMRARLEGHTDAGMKLFAWQPQGHGEFSFFVVASREAEARAIVEAAIEQGTADGRTIGEYESDGWGTDYFKLTVAEPGQIVINEND